MPTARHSFDASFKRRAIQMYDDIRNKSRVAKEFSIDRRTLSQWLGSRQRIFEAADGNRSTSRRLHSGPSTRDPIAEDRLYTWFIEERSAGRAVSNLALQAKMREYAGHQVKASSRWMQGMW
jgi:transposase-like protein